MIGATWCFAPGVRFNPTTILYYQDIRVMFLAHDGVTAKPMFPSAHLTRTVSVGLSIIRGWV